MFCALREAEKHLHEEQQGLLTLAAQSNVIVEPRAVFAIAQAFFEFPGYKIFGKIVAFNHATQKRTLKDLRSFWRKKRIGSTMLTSIRFKP